MLRLQMNAGEGSVSVMDDVDMGKTSSPHTAFTERFSSQQISLSTKALGFLSVTGSRACWSERRHLESTGLVLTEASE